LFCDSTIINICQF
jgi:hypothetical protein